MWFDKINNIRGEQAHNINTEESSKDATVIITHNTTTKTKTTNINTSNESSFTNQNSTITNATVPDSTIINNISSILSLLIDSNQTEVLLPQTLCHFTR